MSSAMTRLFRLPGLGQFIPRRGLASKPAGASFTTKDTIIGFGTFMVCFLGPSGWILSHMENYKRRD